MGDVMSASVAIEIRAIAAGPAADGHVRLTLSVMPVVPVQNDTRPTVSMADWPRWTEIVEKAFKHRGQDNKWSVSYTHLTLPTIYSV